MQYYVVSSKLGPKVFFVLENVLIESAYLMCSLRRATLPLIRLDFKLTAKVIGHVAYIFQTKVPMRACRNILTLGCSRPIAPLSSVILNYRQMLRP